MKRLAIHKPSARGFTLIELLVVISIIALLLGITFPFLRATIRGSSMDLAVGQVNNAVSATRAFATRNKPFLVARRTGATLRNANDHGDGYSGCIALFATDGTIRILENDENAYDPAVGWLELVTTPRYNGYAPIQDLDDLRLPGRVLALGIVRTGTGTADVQLIPPPFAIRFSNDGVLTQGEANNSLPAWDRFVYVSGEGNTSTSGSGVNKITANLYAVSKDRPAGLLDLEQYGRSGTERLVDGRVKVPFDAIETVSGVLLVDPDQIPEEFDGTSTGFAIDRLSPYTPAESAAMLLWSNGQPWARPMFFNRYTGQDLTR